MLVFSCGGSYYSETVDLQGSILIIDITGGKYRVDRDLVIKQLKLLGNRFSAKKMRLLIVSLNKLWI